MPIKFVRTLNDMIDTKIVNIIACEENYLFELEVQDGNNPDSTHREFALFTDKYCNEDDYVDLDMLFGNERKFIEHIEGSQYYRRFLADLIPEFGPYIENVMKKKEEEKQKSVDKFNKMQLENAKKLIESNGYKVVKNND